jgi:hypothetical protein
MMSIAVRKRKIQLNDKSVILGSFSPSATLDLHLLEPVVVGGCCIFIYKDFGPDRPVAE